MRFILLCLISFNLFASITIPESLKKADNMPFVAHIGDGKWDNYLVMNIPFGPAVDIFSQILKRENRQMINRGEAHITVITPIEFWDILRPAGITMEEINNIALKKEIQKSQFTIECLGVGVKKIEGKEEKTFYVVVSSQDLINIRKEVHAQYIKKGGNPNLFDPLKYYPHITIGFTKRDLHESDGIIKDKLSCLKKEAVK